MKVKIGFVLLCCFSILVSCAETLQDGEAIWGKLMTPGEPKPIVGKEDGRTVVTLGAAQFLVPAGFLVLNVIEDNPLETYTESTVIMGKSENDDYTVIMFTMHQAVKGNEFIRTDLRESYAAAVYVNYDLNFVDDAVSYVARMPMTRRLFLERPVCKVVSGYKYIKKETRYRFDIYRNLENQDPLNLVAQKGTPVKMDKSIDPAMLQKGKQELKAFRSVAFALIKNHIRWP